MTIYKSLNLTLINECTKSLNMNNLEHYVASSETINGQHSFKHLQVSTPIWVTR